MSSEVESDGSAVAVVAYDVPCVGFDFEGCCGLFDAEDDKVHGEADGANVKAARVAFVLCEVVVRWQGFDVDGGRELVGGVVCVQVLDAEI